MRILFVSPSPYIPAIGGAFKANKIIAETFAATHEVRVLALARKAVNRKATLQEFIDFLAASQIGHTTHDRTIQFALNGVEVHAVDGGLRLATVLEQQIKEFEPDWIWVSSEDWRQICLQRAVVNAPGRVIYMVHTPPALPFGPSSADPRPVEAKLLGSVEAVVTPSQHLADYIRQWAPTPLKRVDAIYLPVFGSGDVPTYSNFDSGVVMMINPSVIKGISIFLELARTMPDIEFGAVPTWATTPADLEALNTLPNVSVFAASEHIDDIYRHTRVLLVPSLWHEAFGLVVVEAMLRGIPVISSDSGGIPEAMLGSDQVIPVRPITSYSLVDGQPAGNDPPEQDCAAWRETLRSLLGDRDRYQAHSDAVRERARAFVAGLSVSRYEELMRELSTNR